MTYYKTIHTPSEYGLAVSSGKYSSFDDLRQAGLLNTGPSGWSEQHLYACRVLCGQPQHELPILADLIRDHVGDIDPCIDRLIEGPGLADSALARRTESELVREHGPDPGYAWAALAALVRGEQNGRVQTLASERPFRAIHPPERLGFVDPRDVDSEESLSDRPSTGSSDRPLSLVYVNETAGSPPEELTNRFISCITRCIINHAQPRAKQLPYLEFQDDRRSHTFTSLTGDSIVYRAINDGGIQVFTINGMRQVAMLEAKRSFLDMENGVPNVSNNLLAQIVGEALAQKSDPRAFPVDNDK